MPTRSEQDFVALGSLLAARAGEGADVQLPLHADRIFPEQTALAAQAAQRLEAAAQAADELGGDEAEESPRASAIARASAELRADAAALRGAFAAASEAEVAVFEQLVASTAGGWPCARSRRGSFHERFAQRLEGGMRLREPLRGGMASPRGRAGLGGVRARLRCASRSKAVRTGAHARGRAREGRRSGEETAETLAQLARMLGGRTLGL